MAKFFEKFPTRKYNGVDCKLITTRTALSTETKRSYTAFYDVDVKNGDRPDTVSDQIYGDSYYDWLIYYANGIVDPYYQWCLDDESLEKTIEHKYGSLAEAKERIAFYRVKSSDETITTSAYASLAQGVKKYWTPVIDDANTALYYKRAELDHTINTNRICTLTGTVTETNVSNLLSGERVTQTTAGRVTASGQVLHVDAKIVTLGSVEGEFVVGTVTGASSSISLQIGEVATTGYTLPEEERIYWEPVTFYEYEVEQNEQYRHIRALVPAVADVIVTKHEELVNG
jgi:hypothetical protein